MNGESLGGDLAIPFRLPYFHGQSSLARPGMNLAFSVPGFRLGVDTAGLD
jgi:hypothetical protein